MGKRVLIGLLAVGTLSALGYYFYKKQKEEILEVVTDEELEEYRIEKEKNKETQEQTKKEEQAQAITEIDERYLDFRKDFEEFREYIQHEISIYKHEELGVDSVNWQYYMEHIHHQIDRFEIGDALCTMMNYAFNVRPDENLIMDMVVSIRTAHGLERQVRMQPPRLGEIVYLFINLVVFKTNCDIDNILDHILKVTDTLDLEHVSLSNVGQRKTDLLLGITCSTNIIDSYEMFMEDVYPNISI